MYLQASIQRKTNFFIYLCFLGRILQQIKKHLSWEVSFNITQNVFWFVYTCLQSSTFIYICLDSSSDLSTLVYIRLDLSSDSSLLVHICLHSCCVLPIFLEQIYWTKTIAEKYWDQSEHPRHFEQSQNRKVSE